MKTLLALLLLIPSLSWGKDLSGIKLWCVSELQDPMLKNSINYILFDFIDEEKVDRHSISQDGIYKYSINYKIEPSWILIDFKKDKYNKIDRKSLKIPDTHFSCEIKVISNVNIFIENFYYQKYESKNKI